MLLQYVITPSEGGRPHPRGGQGPGSGERREEGGSETIFVCSIFAYIYIYICLLICMLEYKHVYIYIYIYIYIEMPVLDVLCLHIRIHRRRRNLFLICSLHLMPVSKSTSRELGTLWNILLFPSLSLNANCLNIYIYIYIYITGYRDRYCRQR